MSPVSVTHMYDAIGASFFPSPLHDVGLLTLKGRPESCQQSQKVSANATATARINKSLPSGRRQQCIGDLPECCVCEWAASGGDVNGRYLLPSGIKK